MGRPCLSGSIRFFCLHVRFTQTSVARGAGGTADQGHPARGGQLVQGGPGALAPAIRAVCIRLAEMVADQRHYLAPLPEPQESERRTVLTIVADRLRSNPVTRG